MSMTQARWLVATFVALAVLSFIWGHNPTHLGKPQTVSGAIQTIPVPKDCPLKGTGCELTLPQLGTVLVQAPAAIKPLQKFAFTVTPLGAAAKSLGESLGAINVNFEMVGMDMGINQYPLDRQADGRYQQTIILPVCTSTRTDWVAILSLNSTKGDFVAKIPFVVDRR